MNKLASDLRAAVDDADLSIQHVFSAHLVLAGAGHIESSISHILSEYARIHGNETVGRFVEKTVARNNSLNCEKIKTIVDQFNLSWWAQVEATTLQAERDAVDSLKTLRDQFAHGRRNGTGFTIVKAYFDNAKIFVQKFSVVVLGH
ncbi:HEPN domain-containing protein [Paracoccus pantotrophus]|uniref:HEPN domain-containing protein n=1 Tax=Paracoccus pantotrophus TaxID=82367 RepID=UPI0012DDB27D|nr:HEPN domain-containing protein [Paracoccus pantotrophus]